MEKWGVMDIGSNTIRYLVATYNDGYLEFNLSGLYPARIGRFFENNDAEGIIEDVLPIIRSIKNIFFAEDVSPDNQLIFATEAARKNKVLFELLRTLALVDIKILSPEEEGEYSFVGALVGIFHSTSVEDVAVFDLGGGSLEVRTNKDFISLPLGVLRLKNKFLKRVETNLSVVMENTLVYQEIKDYIKAELHKNLQGFSSSLVIGVGGTSSAIAMMMSAWPVTDYHPKVVHSKYITKETIKRLFDQLISLPVSERSSVKGLSPDRADIILPGMCVILELLDYFGVYGYVSSETGPLWGALISHLRKKGKQIKGIIFK